VLNLFVEHGSVGSNNDAHVGPYKSGRRVEGLSVSPSACVSLSFALLMRVKHPWVVLYLGQ
jgi:hypothetical protein